MIEVKITLPSFEALAEFASKNAGLPISTSATITPEKQAAAIASTAAGKAAKAEKAAAKNPETPVEALKQAVEKTEDAKPARTYETSGIAQKIAKGAAKDKPAMIALLEEFKARDGEGKLTGKALKPEQFDAFEARLDALLAAESLG